MQHNQSNIKRLKPKELRVSSPKPVHMDSIIRRPVYFILENIMDTYNIGGIFRLADALAVEKVFLCGTTSTPPDTKIKKASVNTWQWVPWEYKKSAQEAVLACRALHKGTKIYAIEQDKQSIVYSESVYKYPMAFIVGNETTGLTEQAIKSADITVEIPMHGINTSLNVIVSLAIISSHALDKALSIP